MNLCAFSIICLFWVILFCHICRLIHWFWGKENRRLCVTCELSPTWIGNFSPHKVHAKNGAIKKMKEMHWARNQESLDVCKRENEREKVLRGINEIRGRQQSVKQYLSGATCSKLTQIYSSLKRTREFLGNVLHILLINMYSYYDTLKVKDLIFFMWSW